MKSKWIFATIMGIALFATKGYADQVERCANDSGTIVVGVNQKRYCVSDINMTTWYNAWTWCQGAKGRLATVNEACDSDTAVYSGSSCPNLPSIVASWTATECPNSAPSAIVVSNGGSACRYRVDKGRALCIGNY